MMFYNILLSRDNVVRHLTKAQHFLWQKQLYNRGMFFYRHSVCFAKMVFTLRLWLLLDDHHKKGCKNGSYHTFWTGSIMDVKSRTTVVEEES